MKALMVQLRRMLLSFQIMSRIPVNLALPCESEDMLGSMVYFPLVGAAVGGLMALAAWLGHLLTGSYLAAAALAVLVDVLVTGGIHMDGLGDTCDGFFSGRERDRILEIMHDSRMGTFGGLGLMLTLLLKFAFIAAALERLGGSALERLGGSALGLTFAAPVLSRMCVVLLERIGQSARKGMGSAYVVGMNWRHVAAAFGVGAALLLVVRPVTLLGIPVAAALAYLFNAYFNRKIGGLTGDTLGAANELSALVFYALAALRFIA